MCILGVYGEEEEEVDTETKTGPEKERYSATDRHERGIHGQRQRRGVYADTVAEGARARVDKPLMVPKNSGNAD